MLWWLKVVLFTAVRITLTQLEHMKPQEFFISLPFKIKQAKTQALSSASVGDSIQSYIV